MTSPLHSVSVAGAVFDDHDLALAIRRRDNGHWEPPGGVLELHESVEDCLVREVREETGVTVRPERLTGVYKNMICGVVALVFRCRVTGGSLVCGDETAEVAWFTRDEVSKHMGEAYAIRVLDAFTGTFPAVRSHDGVALIPAEPQFPSMT